MNLLTTPDPLFERISQCPFQMENATVGFGERETKVYYLDSDQKKRPWER